MVTYTFALLVDGYIFGRPSHCYKQCYKIFSIHLSVSSNIWHLTPKTRTLERSLGAAMVCSQIGCQDSEQA